jgi:hypothetical protein
MEAVFQNKPLDPGQSVLAFVLVILSFFCHSEQSEESITYILKER